MPNQITEIETLVNSYTTGDQQDSHVIALTNGDYVITWKSNGEDPSSVGVFGQRYNILGEPIGTDFQITSEIIPIKNMIALTKANDGGFIAAWSSQTIDGKHDILAAIYSNDGTRTDIQGPINTTTFDSQYVPDVLTLQDGNFIIFWTSEGEDNSHGGIFGQRYNNDGSKAGTQISVNERTLHNQTNSTSITLNDGSYVVTWVSWNDGDEDDNGPANGWNVQARHFNADGTAKGDEFTVNSHLESHQHSPDITALKDGGYVITWSSPGQDEPSNSSGYGIFAQRFDHNSKPAGTEISVNTTSANNQRYSSITSLDDGGFLIVWNSFHNVDIDMYAQRFDNMGNKVNAEFLLNDTIAGDQFNTKKQVITTLNDGRVIATWHSPNISGDDSGTAIAAKVIDFTSATSGNDYLTGTDSSNIINGLEGNDTIMGLDGNDSLFGKEGADVLVGGTGNDWLDGGDNDDIAYGGSGNDTLDGGYTGGDVFDGGDGIDTLSLWRHRGGDMTINLEAGTAYTTSGDHFALTSIENAYGSNSGNDLVTGTSGANHLHGAGGKDTLNGAGGNDTLNGENGADLLSGGDGYDKVYGGNEADILNGGLSNDTLDGGNGDDHLIGDNGDDWLYGQDGNDTLDGGTGNDLLKGGAGSDIFSFNVDWGTDTVLDFSTTEDTLDLSYTSFTYTDLTINQQGSDTLIEVTSMPGNSILLSGITASDITESLFIFN